MSDASTPDGTDPRVCTPTGETIWTTSATKQSGRRAYHKNRNCERLTAAGADSVKRDMSYANWKNLVECDRCVGKQTDNRLKETMDGKTIDAWRRRLAETDTTLAAIGRDVTVNHSTVEAHVKENHYEYTPTPERPPVAYSNADGWHYVEDDA